MVFADLRVGYVEIVVVIGCRGISERVVPRHVHTVIFTAELKQIPSVRLPRIADNVSCRNSQLLHTILKRVSIARADSLPVYNRAVCALIILTSGNVLNSVCEIVVNQLYLLRILGKRRGKFNQRSNRFFKVLLRLFEIICSTVEINRKRRDNSASVHIIVKRAVNPEKLGVVVINAVNYVRDIRGLYGNAHIYCLHTVMERCVNLVVCLLVCTGEQIAVEIKII